MKFESGNVYHIYNRGNYKQLIFFSDRNYFFFLEKIQKYLVPHCSILAYCLMPNHFHLLIYADDRSEAVVDNGQLITKNVISNGVRNILSSYSKAINIQEGRSGNLFQQKTKAKLPESELFLIKKVIPNSNYETVCFDYVHQNPVKAGLVFKPQDWKYSSYNEYFFPQKCEFELCEKAVANMIIDSKMLCV